VGFAPLEDIAAHVRTMMAAGAWRPRVDRLPYYERPMSGVLASAGVKPG